MANNLGLKTAYMAIAGIVILVGVLTALFIKDTPEEAGLFPDGTDQSPLSEGQYRQQGLEADYIIRHPAICNRSNDGVHGCAIYHLRHT